MIELLVHTVSFGGNLIMNVGPTARGEFDERAQDRLAAFGRWMHWNSRSIYGCTQAPEEFVRPEGTLMTYNPERKRLYVHLVDYPMGALAFEFYDRVAYAQFLHDGSEVNIVAPGGARHGQMGEMRIPGKIVLRKGRRIRSEDIGALAALGGALYYLNPGIELKWSSAYSKLPDYGFNGIPVALLASNNPLGVIFSGLFLRYLGQGGDNLVSCGFNRYISDIIIALTIYFAGFSKLIRTFLQAKKKKPAVNTPAPVPDNTAENTEKDQAANEGKEG